MLTLSIAAFDNRLYALLRMETPNEAYCYFLPRCAALGSLTRSSHLHHSSSSRSRRSAHPALSARCAHLRRLLSTVQPSGPRGLHVH